MGNGILYKFMYFLYVFGVGGGGKGIFWMFVVRVFGVGVFFIVGGGGIFRVIVVFLVMVFFIGVLRIKVFRGGLILRFL